MKKDSLAFLVGIGLPFLLIIYLLIFSYIPSLTIKPKYNFIYTQDYRYGYDISVVNGKISVKELNNYSFRQEPKFYIYNSNEDKSKPISKEEVEKLSLDDSSRSPDGFSVENSNGTSSIFSFFLGVNNRGIFLNGNGLYRKITDSNYSFKFLGWVING